MISSFEGLEKTSFQKSPNRKWSSFDDPPLGFPPNR